MKHEPKNMNELLTYVEEVAVIDLLTHAMSLDEGMRDALNEPPEGLYLVGSIEPIMAVGRAYFPRSQWNNPKAIIRDFSKITDIKEEIINSNMETVLTVRDLVTKSRFFRNEPTIPVMAMKAGIGIVEQYLSSICRHSRRTHPTYRLEYLVKNEHRNLVDSDEYMHSFEKLLDQVMEFVGDDNWCYYFTKIKGSSLIIEKGIDHRIFKFYENLFKAEDEHADN